jgi:DNA-binding transcriptional LysR family regulator
MAETSGLSSIELRQIRYFLAVVEHRSVSTAARSLGITQPGLARVIGRLEQRLGAVLLTRSSRGTFATAEGERFLKHAKLILNDCERAAQEVRAVASGALGTISLRCGVSYVEDLMGEVTRRVAMELPALNLTVSEGILDDMLTALEEGRCDAILSTFPSAVPEGRLVCEPLLTVTPQIVAGASHELAVRRALTRKDLVGHSWVSMDHPHTLALLAEFFTAESLPAPKPLRTNSLTLLKSILVKGKHLALLPRHCVRREVRSGLFRRLAIPTAVRRPRAGLMYLRRRARSASVERVLEVIRQVCAEVAE